MTAKKIRSKKKRKILWIFFSLIVLLILFLIVLFTFTPFIAEAFFNGFRDFKPKGKTLLPVDIQKAIQNEAVKELSQGYEYQHTDVAAEVDPQDVQIAQSGILADNPLYIFKETGRRIQEFFIFDSLAKTQLLLKHNSWENIETISLLQKNLKQNNPFIKGVTVGIAANNIQAVEGRFNHILSLSNIIGKTDKDKAKAINAVAFIYAEKYFREELILQGLEEKLDDSSMIKIENARAKGLGAFAKILVSYHPDPQILSRELANSLTSETGTNYKELKTAELLQELEDATSGESQKLPLRLSQYILIERFEKKILAMPIAKRQALLDTLVSEIPGNPMREFKTFSRMRRVFTSRELIVYADLYKAKILEHFEGRVLGLSTSSLQSQFITNWVTDPADLRILEALELRAVSQKNSNPQLTGIIKNLITLRYSQISKAYGRDPEKLKDTLFYESASVYPDVLDIKVAVDLDTAFNNAKFVKNLEKKVVGEFASNIPSSLSGVVVSASPETANLLSEITSDIPLASQNEILAAITAETTLDSIQVPETANAINNLVSNLEQNQDIAIVTQSLQVPIPEVISQIDTQVSPPSTQEVLQRTEELTQEIFSAPAGQETPIEQILPPVIQQEIEQVQQATNSIPHVDQTLIQTVVTTVEQTQPSTSPAPAPEALAPPQAQSAPEQPAAPAVPGL